MIPPESGRTTRRDLRSACSGQDSDGIRSASWASSSVCLSHAPSGQRPIPCASLPGAPSGRAVLEAGDHEVRRFATDRALCATGPRVRRRGVPTVEPRFRRPLPDRWPRPLHRRGGPMLADGLQRAAAGDALAAAAQHRPWRTGTSARRPLVGCLREEETSEGTPGRTTRGGPNCCRTLGCGRETATAWIDPVG
jgi:hypothetical protein